MVIAEYTINYQFKEDQLKCKEAVKSYTTIGTFFFFSINKYVEFKSYFSN